jgi:hypothetical protein
MEVYTYDKDGNPIGRKEVPVFLAPKQKVASILANGGGQSKPEIDNILPRISIIWNSIELDTERLADQNDIRKMWVEYLDEQDNQYKIVVVDMKTVSYKLGFELTIWTKYMDDGVQMLENILPFFAPDLHVSIFERGIGIERKAKVELKGVSPNFVFDLNEPDKRVLQWNLTFDMECNLYKPLQMTKDIRTVITRIFATNPKNLSHAQGFQSTTAVTSGWFTPQRLDDRIREVISDFEDVDKRYIEYANKMQRKSTKYINEECNTQTNDQYLMEERWKGGFIDLCEYGFTKVMHCFNESVLFKPYYIGNEQNWTQEEIGGITTECFKVRPNYDVITVSHNGIVMLNPEPYKDLNITNPWLTQENKEIIPQKIKHKDWEPVTTTYVIFDSYARVNITRSTENDILFKDTHSNVYYHLTEILESIFNISFIDLIDTQSIYTNNYFIKVNNDESGLEYGSITSTGENGYINCEVGKNVYTVTYNSPSLLYENPIITLCLPTSSSPQIPIAITNITQYGFNVVLSMAPVISGYKINWTVNDNNTNVYISGGDTSTQINIKVASAIREFSNILFENNINGFKEEYIQMLSQGKITYNIPIPSYFDSNKDISLKLNCRNNDNVNIICKASSIKENSNPYTSSSLSSLSQVIPSNSLLQEVILTLQSSIHHDIEQNNILILEITNNSIYNIDIFSIEISI